MIFTMKDITEDGILTVQVLKDPLEERIHTLEVTPTFKIHSNPVRLLLNGYLQEIFAYYSEIPMKVRAALVYDSDFAKGEYHAYRTKVMDLCLPYLEDKEIHLYFLLGMVCAAFHKLSFKLSRLVSMDHSIFGYLDAYDTNEEFRNLFDHPMIHEEDTPWDVQAKEHKIVDILSSAKVYPINHMLDAGVKINKKQAQSLVQIGPMPGYLETNRTTRNVVGGILNGITNVNDMFQMDNSGRFVIITEKTEVKAPGKLNKHVGIPLTAFKLNQDDNRDVIHDCHTPFFLTVEIKDQKDLKFYRWKYIYENGKEVGFINIDRTDLIGKTVQIRSAMFCMTDTICEKCMGYMSNFLQDTKAWKASAYMYVMDTIGAIIQKLISIKHVNNANMLEVRCHYHGKIYANLKEFLEQEGKNIIERIEFDWIRFRKDVEIDFLGYRSNEDLEKPFRKNWYLLLDGEMLIFEQPIYEPEKEDIYHHKCIQYYIPHDSVFIKAEDLTIMLQGHTGEEKVERDDGIWYDRVKNVPSSRKRYFNQTGETYQQASVEEQIRLFYQYCREVADFDHIIYYEALIFGLMRDGADMRRRLHPNSKSVVFFNITQILSKPNIMSSLSTKIHHGHILNNILVPSMEVEPSEFDIVYNKLWARKPQSFSNKEVEFTCSGDECELLEE